MCCPLKRQSKLEDGAEVVEEGMTEGVEYREEGMAEEDEGVGGEEGLEDREEGVVDLVVEDLKQ